MDGRACTVVVVVRSQNGYSYFGPLRGTALYLSRFANSGHIYQPRTLTRVTQPRVEVVVVQSLCREVLHCSCMAKATKLSWKRSSADGTVNSPLLRHTSLKESRPPPCFNIKSRSDLILSGKVSLFSEDSTSLFEHACIREGVEWMATSKIPVPLQADGESGRLQALHRIEKTLLRSNINVEDNMHSYCHEFPAFRPNVNTSGLYCDK